MRLTEFVFEAYVNGHWRDNLMVTMLPNETIGIVINYGYYFIVSSNILIKLKSSRLSNTNEPIFKLHSSIQSLLKQLQQKFDKEHYNDEVIKFGQLNRYKKNALTLNE